MFRILTYIFILFFSLTQMLGQEEIRSLSAFDEIKVSAGIEVILIQGEMYEAQVSTKKVDVEKLKTEVFGSELLIRWSDSRFSNNKQGKVILTFVKVSEINVSSGATIYSDDCVDAPKLKLKCSSGGNVDLDLNSKDLRVNVSSGGSVELAGQSTDLEASTSSGAYLDARDLITENADVSSSSGGAMKIFVSKNLEASASSGGSVRYDGDPEHKSLNVGKYSGGSVRKI